MKKILRSLAVGVAVGGTGCAFEGAAEDLGGETPENVGEVSSALFVNEPCPANTECFDRTDSTGSIRVRWYRCPFSAASSRPSATCTVGSAFTLVGGGAEIEGSTQPGHLLEYSWPSGESWIAGSKQLAFAQNLRLRAFAVGIQLNNLTKANLKPQVTTLVTSSVGNHEFPAVVGSVDANRVILSAGSSAWSSTGTGQVLVHSYPTGQTAWATHSKQHMMADPGGVSQALISMPICPNGFSSAPFCVARGVFSADSTSGGGYRSAIAFVPSAAWVMTGVGAISLSNNNQSNSGGRPLTDLVPNFGGDGAAAVTKDHHFADPGGTRAFVNALRRL